MSLTKRDLPLEEDGRESDLCRLCDGDEQSGSERTNRAASDNDAAKYSPRFRRPVTFLRASTPNQSPGNQ